MKFKKIHQCRGKIFSCGGCGRGELDIVAPPKVCRRAQKRTPAAQLSAKPINIVIGNEHRYLL